MSFDSSPVWLPRSPLEFHLLHTAFARERDAQTKSESGWERAPGIDRCGSARWMHTQSATRSLGPLAIRSAVLLRKCVCVHGASVAVGPNKPHSHNAGAPLIRPAAAGDNSPTASHHAAGNWFSTPDDRERKKDTHRCWNQKLPIVFFLRLNQI